jgi:hypothetical protein
MHEEPYEEKGRVRFFAILVTFGKEGEWVCDMAKAAEGGSEGVRQRERVEGILSSLRHSPPVGQNNLPSKNHGHAIRGIKCVCAFQKYD